MAARETGAGGGGGVTRYRTHGEAETAAIAGELATGLPGGSTILLRGDLGAGKTAFVRGLVEGLGGDPADVSSPTFTLIQPYAARLRVEHVDLYRLQPAEVSDLGLDELATPDAVVVVEWAERWTTPPADAIRVRIEDAGGDEREIRVDRGPVPEPATRSGSSALPS